VQSCTACPAFLEPRDINRGAEVHREPRLLPPGCEPRAEIGKTIDLELNGKLQGKMALSQRVTYWREVLEKRIEKYPGEVAPYNRLIVFVESIGIQELSEYPDSITQFRHILVLLILSPHRKLKRITIPGTHLCKWRSSKVPLESESLRFYSDRES
jgi:hypothetical protein